MFEYECVVCHICIRFQNKNGSYRGKYRQVRRAVRVPLSCAKQLEAVTKVRAWACVCVCVYAQLLWFGLYLTSQPACGWISRDLKIYPLHKCFCFAKGTYFGPGKQYWRGIHHMYLRSTSEVKLCNIRAEQVTISASFLLSRCSIITVFISQWSAA
jgi:hypothetical protein